MRSEYLKNMYLNGKCKVGDCNSKGVMENIILVNDLLLLWMKSECNYNCANFIFAILCLHLLEYIYNKNAIFDFKIIILFLLLKMEV